MEDVMTEVSVMYRIAHPIRDRWGKSSCTVVEQCGCVSKAEVKSMWVRSSAMIDATFALLGIHVTNNLHANAPATR